MRRVLPSKSAMRKALVASIAAHVAILGVVGPIARGKAEAALTPPEDRWTGTTAELPSSGAFANVDVSIEPQPNAPAAALSPAPAPAPSPAALPAPAVEPQPAPIAEPAPRPKPVAKPRAEASEPAAKPRAEATGEAEDRPKPAPKPRRASAVASNSASNSASSGAPSNGTFGSEGPASVRDLGRAITRAIPPACDADPVWSTLPVGAVGKLEIAVHIDETGHITSAEPRGNSPPKALVNVLRRTIPLLQAGTFAVKDGATAEGNEILELTAIVSDVGADEGAGAALAFEYARGKGKARFTQSSGRHVEISVRVVRIEVGP